MLEAVASSILFPCENQFRFDRITSASNMFEGGDRLNLLQKGL
jgi:hypothetical protein